MDVTKKDQVEALAREHEHVDVLFNVAGYFSFIICLYSIIVKKSMNVSHKFSIGLRSGKFGGRFKAFCSCLMPFLNGICVLP